ncbi:Hypothetical protein FKW44_018922, partial [Caligus rogercresseyi]
MMTVHFLRCNDLKSEPAKRVIIFSDEKTWKMDPMRSIQNDHYIAFGDPDGNDHPDNGVGRHTHVFAWDAMDWSARPHGRFDVSC